VSRRGTSRTCLFLEHKLRSANVAASPFHVPGFAPSATFRPPRISPPYCLCTPTFRILSVCLKGTLNRSQFRTTSFPSSGYPKVQDLIIFSPDMPHATTDRPPFLNFFPILLDPSEGNFNALASPRAIDPTHPSPRVNTSEFPPLSGDALYV